MNVSDALFVFASAFAGCIASYPALATAKAWPMGSIYRSGQSAIIYLGVMAFGLGYIGFQAFQNKTSWLMLIWFILASFFGPSIIPIIFRRFTGSLSIVGAVMCLIGAVAGF